MKIKLQAYDNKLFIQFTEAQTDIEDVFLNSFNDAAKKGQPIKYDPAIQALVLDLS